MTTFYYQPLPQIPEALLVYCRTQNYPLSLKKQYIMAQLIALKTEATIDDLVYKSAFYSNSISRSSIYLVLQWMIAQGLVRKTANDDNLNAFYRTNFEKLNSLTLDYPAFLTEKEQLTFVA